MPIRREGTLNISGNGAPALPVPNPNDNAGGVAPGQEAYNPAGGTMNFNPIPNNTPVNPGDAVGFVSSFRFGDQHRTGDPLKDMAQDTFNRIKDAYGHNQAWTWMMSNAWNQLGGYGPGGMREIMDKAGIVNTDSNRIINTYGSSKAKYFDGLKAQTQPGGFFRPDAQWDSITKPFRDYNFAYSTARQKAGPGGNFTPPPLPQGYVPGQWGQGTNFQSTGTNTNPVTPQGYGGQVGINPATGKPYGQASNVYIGQDSQPVVGTPPPSVPSPSTPQSATQNAPAVTTPPATDQTGWDTWRQTVQNRQPASPTTVNPFGSSGTDYRYTPKR